MRPTGVIADVRARPSLVPAAALCVLVLALTLGCASESGGAAPAPATSATLNHSPGRSSSGPSSPAVDIVGAWTVQAQGADANTVLVLGDDLELWASCGTLHGGWAADSTRQFVAGVYGVSGTCLPSPPTSAAQLLPAWLADAASFTVSGSSAKLLDDAGHVVAELSRTSKAVGNAQAMPAGPYPPTPDAKLTARLSTPAALPDGVQLVTGADLVGRWIPAKRGANPKAYLVFAANGTWQSYDGCNEDDGRWRDSDGHIVALGGAVAGVGWRQHDRPHGTTAKGR